MNSPMNIPPIAIAANPTLAAKAQPSTSSSPITSPELIAKALGLTETQTIITTVLSGGPLTGKLLASINSQPAILANNAPQDPEATKAPSAGNLKNEINSQQAITSFWLKLTIPKAGSILLIVPTTNTGSQDKAPPSGTRVPIKLSPSGQIELTLPKLNADGSTKNRAITTTPLLLSSTPANNIGSIGKPAAAFATTPSSQDRPQLIQPSPISQALSTLSKILTVKGGGSNSQAQLLNSIQQLQTEVSKTTPVIQKQLLPNKLTDSLAQLLQGVTRPSQAPEDLSAALKTSLGIANSHPAITHLQQISVVAQQLSNKLPPTTSLFTALLKGLPSSTASHEAIQESRAAIAQWLNQELGGQITRLARQQAANASQPAERNDSFQHQQEIPLKLGDEFTTLQLKIEEKREHEQKNEDNKREANTEKKWSIFLKFEIPALPHQTQESKSELSVEMTLHQQTVNIEFWCSEPLLQKEIQTRSRQLEEEMTASGLKVDSLAVNTGEAPSKRIAVSQTRIDLKT